MNQTLPSLQHICPPEEKKPGKVALSLKARQQQLLIESRFQSIASQLRKRPLKPSSKVITSLLSKLKQQARLAEEEK